MSLSVAIEFFRANYAKFNGCARRSKYWFLELFLVLTNLRFSPDRAGVRLASTLTRLGISQLAKACVRTFSGNRSISK